METFNRNNQAELQIDNVLSSQRELGPSIPDGGYAWIVFVGAVFFQGLFPSISIALGTFLLFSRLENSAPLEPYLWDNNLTYVSLSFTAVLILTEPFSTYLSKSLNFPRFVTAAGNCLTCGGLLIIWLCTNSRSNNGLFLLAGSVTGLGTSIVLSQVDLLITQYFHLKLESVKVLLYVVNSLGYVFTPMALGHNIIKIGILQVIVWYQVIMIHGIIVCIIFKKPKYLKSQKRKYKLIQGILDDEEDIFEKNVTELQNPRHVNNNIDNTKTDEIDLTVPNSSNNNNNAHETCTSSTEHNIYNAENTIDNFKQNEIRNGCVNWVKFRDESNVQSTKAQSHLQSSFALDFKNDLDGIDRIDDNHIEMPQPLFSETHINNNTSYSYDSAVQVEEPIVFMPITKSVDESICRKCLDVFKKLTFYRTLIFTITTQFSIFTFWTLFPSYLYYRIDYLKINQTTIILGCVSIGSLFFTTISNKIKLNSKTRPIILWMFCWIGAIGYLIISETTAEGVLIFGAIDVALSITALQIFGAPFIKSETRGESTTIHVLLCVLTGVLFTFFLCINITYKNCFRLMGVLQLLTGSLWLTNFIFKKIQKQMNMS